jgi:hypothetical protein
MRSRLFILLLLLSVTARGWTDLAVYRRLGTAAGTAPSMKSVSTRTIYSAVEVLDSSR